MLKTLGKKLSRIWDVNSGNAQRRIQGKINDRMLGNPLVKNTSYYMNQKFNPASTTANITPTAHALKDFNRAGSVIPMNPAISKDFLGSMPIKRHMAENQAYLNNHSRRPLPVGNPNWKKQPQQPEYYTMKRPDIRDYYPEELMRNFSMKNIDF